jgi:hypothetical protein
MATGPQTQASGIQLLAALSRCRVLSPSQQDQEPGQNKRSGSPLPESEQEHLSSLAPYPHGCHDHEGKEAGSHHVPDASAVQLQGHSDDQYAQDK